MNVHEIFHEIIELVRGGVGVEIDTCCRIISKARTGDFDFRLSKTIKRRCRIVSVYDGWKRELVLSLNPRSIGVTEALSINRCVRKKGEMNTHKTLQN